ncbi:MAG: iron ABC transporter permease [Bacillota bacterium]|nr:iron ABC transporter permease [Bacillota bacterium]
MTELSGRRKNHNILPLITLAIFLLPIFTIIFSMDASGSENWIFFKNHLLPESFYNTIYLTFMASALAGLLGFLSAYLVNFFEYPLSRFFKWSFVLPMAVPPYIAGYVYAGMLGYTGNVQIMARQILGYSIPYQYLDIMNLNGAVLIYGFMLYPYVYLIVRSYLNGSATQWVESSRVLGLGMGETLRRVILPLSRPSIVMGTGMVMMEVISDYGLVKYFGIRTLGTDIFSLWFGSGDLSAATRVSLILLVLVISLLLLDTLLKGKKKYHLNVSKSNPIRKMKLKGLTKWSAFAFSIVVMLIGFVIPVAQLIEWGTKSIGRVDLSALGQMIMNTFKASSIALVIIVLVTFFLARYSAREKGVVARIVDQGVKLGYSIPGAVIGVGVLILFIGLDRSLAPLYQWLSLNKSLVISSSLFVLYFAYASRFLLLGYNSFYSGFMKHGSGYFDSARTLGMSRFKASVKVDVPMQRMAFVSASILIVIDIMKELPLTLMLRPFNYETLATKTFEYANDERLQEAAVPALIILSISVVGILVLSNIQKRRK